MIAVTGANGQLGRKVVQTLLKTEAPENIIAIVRNASNAQVLRASGVIVREADYDKPETLVQALIDVDKLLLISSSEVGKRIAQHKAVVDAAMENKVSLLVYTSLLKAGNSPLLLANEHAQTEAYLKEVNAPYVILRNGWYTENYSDNVNHILATKTVVGAAKQGIISSASRQDYADAAVCILTDANSHIGETYELAGDKGFSLKGFAEEISNLTSTSLNLVDMDAKDYCQALTDAGLPEGMATAISDAELHAGSGWLHDDSQTLSRLIGRPTTPLKESLIASLNR
ncbi:NAD(P)-dependent oxidoreductase [Alteromonas sp. KUL42]|uniref:SDR family oxidoreductase n=1 Tax=Alteromonas sp. KUL42 TaxID=2480797 RepID=UPI001035DD7E|nr:SDR family oxidoreductase [Alteromonas sp. KUL42]TAP37717.1 SDR family oxidoreductase [Alteromonas sp. KUL42]GEA06159.1 NAD(P)-dependent oxidoreductase [Alteromonas sp. KUL42]